MMNLRRKLLFGVLVLLLVSAGIVASQPLTNYTTQRFVMGAGGMAESANYTVTSVFGQLSPVPANGSSYKVSGGFLTPHGGGGDLDGLIWLPVVR